MSIYRPSNVRLDTDRGMLSFRPRLILAVVVIWALASLLTSVVLYQPVIGRFFVAPLAFVVQVVISLAGAGAVGVLLILLIIRFERVQSPRRFFKVERLDIKGVWLTAGLVLAFDVTDAAFLRGLLFAPIGNYMASVGIPVEFVGLATAPIPSLAPLLALFLTVFLVVFFWVEIPEEMVFRGYVQNVLQDRVGKNIAMFLSAIIWDLAHLFALGSVAERLFLGLILAYVFRIRQNTTGVMIFHSVGNRSLLLATTIPAIWSITLPSGYLLLLNLVILVVMLAAVIGGWRVLKLDVSR